MFLCKLCYNIIIAYAYSTLLGGRKGIDNMDFIKLLSTVYVIVDNEVAILKEVNEGILNPISCPIELAKVEEIVSNEGYSLI